MSDNEMRLARHDLGPGVIDLGYGEPVVVQDILKKYVDMSALPTGESLLNSKYQPPQGNKELVELLEAKYGAKVVVTNGAKQGISATMFALKKLGHKSCMIHSPYWVSTPTLISDSGLSVEYLDSSIEQTSNAFMLTSPNNPDGKELTRDQLDELSKDAKAEGVTLIHDAAYYTPIYTEGKDFIKVGDAQIYSFSKMFGLSGLRLGYVVVHNEELLAGITEYVERSCSGVSTASQAIALSIERNFRDNPEKLAAFEAECREAIVASRKELASLRPEVIEIEPCLSNSMFAWGKVGPELNAKAAKVNIIDGDLFGKPGYVRMNIAMPSDIIKTAVERLNRGEKHE